MTIDRPLELDDIPRLKAAFERGGMAELIREMKPDGHYMLVTSRQWAEHRDDILAVAAPEATILDILTFEELRGPETEKETPDADR